MPEVEPLEPPRFNRYMVECKLRSRNATPKTELVLIATWWNVNTMQQMEQIAKGMVLIDTWWNVNQMPYTVDGYANWVLIDTWWNVNT